VGKKSKGVKKKYEMFETLVTGLLTNLLGSYIDPKCFSGDKINVAVWSGYVVLHALEIKPEVFSHPALSLVRGVCGSIEIKIPWNRLHTDSVVITIDDVYLMVRTEDDLIHVLMKEDEFTIKKLLLEELYAQAKRKQEEAVANTKENNGFAARLINKIIDNLEVSLPMYFSYGLPSINSVYYRTVAFPAYSCSA
jgi:hypothetical protein